MSTVHALAALKFCFKTCVAMKFVDDDDDDDDDDARIMSSHASSKLPMTRLKFVVFK